jgi:hypothetical protein
VGRRGPASSVPEWVGNGQRAGALPPCTGPAALARAEMMREPSPEVAAVCSRCPVRGECLAWSLEQGSDLDGVFGGFVPERPAGAQEGVGGLALFSSAATLGSR